MDAWTERMEGNKSICYKLNSSTKKFIIELDRKTQQYFDYNVKIPANISVSQVNADFMKYKLSPRFIYGKKPAYPHVKFSLTTTTPTPPDYLERVGEVNDHHRNLSVNNMEGLIKELKERYEVTKIAELKNIMSGSGLRESTNVIQTTVSFKSNSNIENILTFIRQSNAEIDEVNTGQFYFVQATRQQLTLNEIKKRLEPIYYIRGVYPFPKLREERH